MDPNTENQKKFELPPRPNVGDTLPQVAGGAEPRPAAPEMTHNPSGPATATVTQDDQTQAAAQAVQAVATVPTQPQAGQSLHPAAPAVADDLDLIEKEWVQKAKGIVEQTKHDPYNQNKEMNLFKADYMKKRYNRDVKVDMV